MDAKTMLKDEALVPIRDPVLLVSQRIGEASPPRWEL